MNSSEIFSIALGLQRPWIISDVVLETSSSEEKELHIYLDFERGYQYLQPARESRQQLTTLRIGDGNT